MPSIPSAVPPEFCLLRTGGREPELAIIGSEEAFAKLAFRITDALAARKEQTCTWGSSLVVAHATEVGRANSDTSLNFTIDGAYVQNARSWQPLFGTWWVAALGIVGLVALVYAAMKLVF